MATAAVRVRLLSDTEDTEAQRTQRTRLSYPQDNDPVTTGLPESAYEQCMAHEMTLHQMSFRLQVPTPVEHKGLRLDCAYKADVIVQERVIVEFKSVETLTLLHHAQLLTYMKVSRAEVGLLIKFNVPRLIDGVRRFRI